MRTPVILVLLLGGCSGGSPDGGGSSGSEGVLTWNANTVSDSGTGLTWQRALPATYAGCAGSPDDAALNLGGPGSCTWAEAKAYEVDPDLRTKQDRS